MRFLGLLTLGFCAVHGRVHLARGHAEDLLWACYVANLLIAAGLLMRWAGCNAVGTLWLATGLPIWLLDLAGGGEFFPTSLLTHVGGLVTGLAGLRVMGVPDGTWWRAALGFLALIFASRWLTPPEANVNVAFRVWNGWERRFSSYSVYLSGLVSVHAAAFYGLEQALRKAVAP
ncbi:MAG: hypothetical protein HY303_04555 [Candidatus Wallbacteria bacterium]|nr:hypothetical protein [Candidatus Wallbacteria bacterium]